MGLDMYLHKRTWVGGASGEELVLGGALDTVEASRVVYIVEEVGSWRKANAIHRWFVEHVQGGDDDCRVHEVSRDHLHHLLRGVQTVLAHPGLAARLLPTREGFFFGSTEYGDGYFDDLRETKRILTEALAAEGCGFEYVSSW